MAENILQQFGTQLFSNSCRVMSDLYEYHDYIAYGVIKDDKITGFCQIVWDIEFSAVYLPLSHILIGIADEQYKSNKDLETDVPTIKYGVDFLCRNGRIERVYLYPDTEDFLLIERNVEEQITFVGEHKEGIRNGFGVEINYADTKYSMLYGIWQNGTLKYQYKDKKWVEVN